MEIDDPNIPADIKALGRHIRLLFYEGKSRKLKHPYKPKGRHDQMTFFYRAAALVKHLSADPQDFVTAAFQYCKVKGGPFANQLGGAAAEAWYRQYLEGKGIDVTTLGKRPEKPEPAMYDVVFACDADLAMDVEIGVAMLRLNTGSEDPAYASNIPILRSRTYEIPLIARALLGYHDEEVLKIFGKEILEFFQTQPNYTAAAERAGYPIQLILQCLSYNQR
jgi:hypothetical protein